MISKVNSMGYYNVPRNFNSKRNNNSIRNEAKTVSFEGGAVGTLSKLHKRKGLLNLAMLVTIAIPSMLKAVEVKDDFSKENIVSSIIQNIPSNHITSNFELYSGNPEAKSLKMPTTSDKSVSTNIIRTTPNDFSNAKEYAEGQVLDAARARAGIMLNTFFDLTNQEYQNTIQQFQEKAGKSAKKGGIWGSIIGGTAGAVGGFFVGLPTAIVTGPVGVAIMTAKGAMWGAVAGGASGAVGGAGKEILDEETGFKKINNLQILLAEALNIRNWAFTNEECSLETRKAFFQNDSLIPDIVKKFGQSPVQTTSILNQEQMSAIAKKIFPENDGKFYQTIAILPEKNSMLSNIQVVFGEVDSGLYTGRPIKSSGFLDSKYDGIKTTTYMIPGEFSEFVEEYMNISSKESAGLGSEYGSLSIESMNRLEELSNKFRNYDIEEILKGIMITGGKNAAKVAYFMNKADKELSKGDLKELTQLEIWNDITLSPFVIGSIKKFDYDFDDDGAITNEDRNLFVNVMKNPIYVDIDGDTKILTARDLKLRRLLAKGALLAKERIDKMTQAITN